jgi:hypothetical protein
MGKKVLIITCALFLPLSFCSSSYGRPIPDTGQMKCYDNSGEIPCPQPGESFCGQDGNYTINPPSYSKLDGNGSDLPDEATEWVMVRDNVTGLIWEVKTDDGSIHDRDDTYGWIKARDVFIPNLNATSLGVFSDWRLPTRKELGSILDYGRQNPATSTFYFQNTMAARYWSSTGWVLSGDMFWSVNFENGVDDPDSFSTQDCVRAVRDGHARDKFIDNGDGTVTDTSRGLMWQEATVPGTHTWEQALSRCEDLTSARYSDWRLPTIKELSSIVHFTAFSPAIDTNYFPNASASFYWSSTSYARGVEAWGVDFSFGGKGYGKNKSDYGYFRAVRGGQFQSLGNLVISAPGQAERWMTGEERTIAWDSAGIADNVKITLSRQGGMQDTFGEVIAESIPNNGSYKWTVTGPESFNCALRVEPVSEPGKGTTQSLFSILTLKNAWIEVEKQSNPAHYKLTFNALYADGVWPVEVTWISSDPAVATVSESLLAALKNGYVEVTTGYQGKAYKKGVFVYTETDTAEIESNNTKGAANTMTEGRFYQGKVLEEDTDWFKFTFPTDSLLNIGFLSCSTSADVKVEIFDASYDLMASAISTNGNHLTFPLGLLAGNYYLKLSPEADIDQDNKYVLSYKLLDTLAAKEPVTLDLGETKSGTINNLGDYTDFTFSLSQDEGIKITFTPSGDAAKYRVSLLDSTNAVVDQVDCLNYYPVSLEAVHVPGDYILRITSIDTVDVESPFTVQLSASTQQVEEEENDAAVTATAYDITQPMSGRLSTNTDLDFFSFDLSTPSLLALAFSCPGSTKNFYLTVYKESEDNPIDGISVLNGKATTLHMGLGTGRYFIEVVGDGVNVERVQKYTLTITDSDQTNLEIESNNTLRFANAIDTASSRKGRIYSSVDKDYYGFHVAEEGFFTVHFTPSTMTGDYRVSVVDENDFVLESYTSYDGQELNQEMYNIPRNFYIKIEPNGGIDQYKSYEVSLTSACQIVGLKQLVAVSISGQSPNMTSGGAQTATAIASYSDATSEVIASPAWSSLDNGVATVDAAGLVMAMTRERRPADT